jgi:hypothetical protein
MNRRAAVYLAWSLGGLSVAMFVGASVFTLLALLAKGESLYGMGELAVFALFLAFPVVGTLISTRRPENAIGWVCMAAGLCWMSIGIEEQLKAYALATSGQPLTSVTYAALTQGLWVPPVGLLGIYMILLFPDGKLPSRRWHPLAWFAGFLMVLLVLGFAFLPGPLEGYPGVRNPLGIESLAWATDIAVFVILLFPACILASAASLVFRYRRARCEVRQQIKWLAFAACFVGATYFCGLLGQLLFAPASFQAGGPPEPMWVSVSNNLVFLSYVGIPVAVGFAVMKYRLYDIEIIINRALVYGSLTLSLAGTYLGSVVALQYAFRSITGGDSQLAVVASTLAIAALFVPLRRRIQAFIDRRFYRSKYDAARTLEAFSKRLRDETDLEALSGDLDRVVRETVQPAHVSVWLRHTDKAVFREKIKP